MRSIRLLAAMLVSRRLTPAIIIEIICPAITKGMVGISFPLPRWRALLCLRLSSRFSQIPLGIVLHIKQKVS